METDTSVVSAARTQKSGGESLQSCADAEPRRSRLSFAGWRRTGAPLIRAKGSRGLKLEGRTGGQPWCRPGPVKAEAGVAVSGTHFPGHTAEKHNAPHVSVRGAS